MIFSNRYTPKKISDKAKEFAAGWLQVYRDYNLVVYEASIAVSEHGMHTRRTLLLAKLATFKTRMGIYKRSYEPQ